MPDNLVSFSARTIDQGSKEKSAELPQLMISADSHAQEPDYLWKQLPASIRDRMPPRPMAKRPEGSTSCDPKLRVKDMDMDKVRAEVLYPDRGLTFFGLDQDVQETLFPIYNDWLADFCKHDPKRLYGITCVSAYDIDKAIKEMHRGLDMGLMGVLIWEVPDPRLPFTSNHYEKLYAAAAECGAPVHVHILTGYSYHKNRKKGIDHVRGSVNIKTSDTITSLFDILWGGAFTRHPKMKLALIESEVGWIPFILQQWDYYFHRFKKQEDFPITQQPSDIFRDHCYCTFMDDFMGSRTFGVWGEKNVMWSSDYPHPNMTWPNSRAFAARQIADYPAERQKQLLSQNCIDLYGLKL
jgi:predicted TIM-barrel fold metal-dependent hydrolase